MKRWLKLLLASVFLPAFAVAPPAAASSDPIKIGIVYPMTGPWAGIGSPMINAIKQAFDEEKYTVAGRKIELIIEDGEGKPDVIFTKLRKLVERDRVHLLHAVINSAAAYGAREYIHAQGVPWVTVAASAGLTRDKASPYVFRFVPSTFQWAYAPTKWLKEKQGWQKITWIGSNYTSPREAFEVIKKVYGDSIVDAQWPPVGNPDFAPFLAKVEPKKADGLVVAMWGSDAVRIVRQYEEYGLKGKLPFFGMAAFTTEEMLPGMPPALEGVMSAYNYCGSLDTPSNKRFVEGFKARYKGLPGAYQYMTYTASKTMMHAIREIGGKVEDRPAYLAALAKARVEGPMGPVSFDERRGIVSDFYVLKVVKKDGQLQNECVEKLSQVKDPYDLFP